MAAALTLPGEFTVVHAAELREQWRAQLAPRRGRAARGDVTLIASGVLEVDAAGVQLLLALHRQLGNAGRALRIESPSATLRDACSALGVAVHLGVAS